MPTRNILASSLPLPLLLAACTGGAASAPPAASAAAAKPAEAPRPLLDLASLDFEPPPGLAFYYFVILRRGPTWTAEVTPEVEKISAGHMANIQRLAREGKLVLAGPFLDADGAGDMAGIFVFKVGTAAEVQALLESDPGVQSGRFAPEVRAWMAGDGIRTTFEPAPADEVKEKLSCLDSARHEQWDFWLGDWQVHTPDGKLAGRNRIEKGQYGCVLREQWTGAKGVTGESVNYVDPKTGEWVQLWTDATGGVIRLRGGLDGKAMALAGDYLKPDGSTTLMRARWTPLDGGQVEQRIEESTDGGKSWNPWFLGLYSR